MQKTDHLLEISENHEKLEDLMSEGSSSYWIRCSESSSKSIENSDDLTFFVPPGATFHIGDVTDVNDYSEKHEIKFDLIIADPPWFSRSVKRKKTYEMNEDALDTLNLSEIAEPDALIVFWLTNRAGLKEELEQRFDGWGMEIVAKWKWLKVTTEGRPVCGFDKEKHKVPFEKIFFAMKKGAKRVEGLPESFVFASVPMAVHSHKPPLLDLLRHFGVPFSRPLELFARSLLPGTHSIGYEPLLLQSQVVYEQVA